MMKKLMVLTLVLGMASLASAGYMLQIDAVDPAAANVIGDGAFVAVFISASGPISANLLYTGNLSAITDMSADLQAMLGPGIHLFAEFVDGKVPPVLPTGNVARIAAAGELPITVSLLNSDDLSVISSVVLTPEPMSLMLLGLGGLFLRRRS